MRQFWFLLLLLISICCISCDHFHAKKGLPFGTVKGTHFKEVRRIFNNGLKFDKQGYQLEPSWDLYFLSDDSVLVFSPKTKKYYGFHVYFDHDSIFNMVDAWFKVKKIATDSLILQALRVENKIILDDDEGSKVFLTFYSDRYIKTHSAESIRKMGIPGPKDTLFIRARTKLVNTKIDSAFAAREPVVLKSKSPLVAVEKVERVSTPIEEVDASDNYLAPEYNIAIQKAYEDFDYSFYVYVDDKGKMYFRKSAIACLPEYRATYEQIMKGLIDGYLHHYLDVTPGSTLGIVHASSILLNVAGKKE
ncbi:hypothetical protein ACPPVU_03190 [Mucilaginibacter sp. McL0603]|uniref:hypothetical protein n=1 Tax=Mucilaginibacter sp. McL0603 TaxID=3415670 RepID=UPI003CECF6BC